MKRVFVLLLIQSSLLLAQTRTWTQSSAADFSSGTASNVIVTDNSGGEIQLANPLARLANDTLDSSIPQYVGYDDAGNYVTGWVSGSDVYAQKFTASHQPLTPALRVDDSGGVFNGNPVGVALLDNGDFLVSWRGTSPSLRLDVRNLQFFDASGKKIGDNIELPGIDATGTTPLVVADQLNDRYAVIVPLKGPAVNNYYLSGWIYSASGQMIRDSIRIVPNDGNLVESEPAGACYNGQFVLTWSGFPGDYGPGNIYAAYYDSNLVSITGPIMMASQTSEPSAAFDKNGNSCVTWVGNSYTVPGPPGQIFGQVLDSTGKKIGGVSQLTNNSAGSVSMQNLTFSNDTFRVEWTLAFSNGQASQQWASYWKLEQVTQGSYISAVSDVGVSGTIFKTLSWDGTTPAGTQLRFQLRSAATSQGVQSATWLGPTSGSDYYTTASGENINPANSPGRYLQVKVLLNSAASGTTPVLTDFTVSYSPSDTMSPSAPSDIAAAGGHRMIAISWSKSTSPDVWRYYIYRAAGSLKTSTPLLAAVDAEQTSYVDSSVVYDSLYTYGVTAVDSALNESPVVQSGRVSPKTMTIFVSASGSPAGNGTMSKPFSKISYAVTFSGKGDTVYVLPGEYDENVKLKEDISLIGSGAATSKIIAPDLSTNALTTAANDVVKGFTIQTGNGLNCSGGGVLITENILIHQGNGFDVGILAGNYQNIVVSKNIILNYSIGIQSVGSPTPSVTQTMIRNNIILCPRGVQDVWNNVSLINNTIVVMGLSGTAVSVSGGEAVMMNNCLAAYPAQGGALSSIGIDQGSTITTEYNDRWGFNNDPPDTFSSTNISVDPQFRNLSENDFHLSPGSGCINKGDPASQYNNVDGSRNDIGAYGGSDPVPDYMTFSLATGLSITNVSGFPGDTVSVDIISSDAAGMKDADIDLQFDSSLMTFLSADTTALTDGFKLSTSETNGGVGISLNSGSPIVSGSGSIASLKFLLNPAPRTADSHGTIEFGDVSLLDSAGNKIVVSSVTDGSCVLRARAAHPNEIFVDASNTGAADGTILHPYPKIQGGIDNAVPGDTVIVAAGDYAGPITMKSGVFVLGLGANSTTIEFPNNPLIFPATVVNFNGVDSTGIQGFTLVNRASNGNVVTIMSSDAVIAMNRIDESGGPMNSIVSGDSSRVRIEDNYFAESQSGPATVISVSTGSAHISGNVFSASSGISTIQVQSADSSTISNNTFYLSQGDATGVFGYTTRDMVVANNLFIGGQSAGSGIRLSGAESTLIVNNVFDVGQNGIIEDNGTQQIYNNIFYGNSVAFNVKSSTIHEYNLLWKNSLNFGGGQPDPTEIIADPEFVDRAEGNYRLLPTSPAIDAGDPAPRWDNRDGTRNDIGLYGGPFADSTMFGSVNSRLYIGNVPGSPGDTVVVPIYAADVSGIAGMKLSLSYDGDNLTLLQAHTTQNTQGFVLARNQIGNSMAELTLQGYRSLVIDSGAVMEISFMVSKSASGNIPLSFQSVQLVGANTAVVDGVGFENGKIVLSPESVSREGPQVPKDFALYQNYPNPFNPTTVIGYQLPAVSRVSLVVYDVLGREVATLVNGEENAGIYKVTFNGARYASGVYFYRLVADPVEPIVAEGTSGKRFVAVKKFVLIK